MTKKKRFIRLTPARQRTQIFPNQQWPFQSNPTIQRWNFKWVWQICDLQSDLKCPWWRRQMCHCDSRIDNLIDIIHTAYHFAFPLCVYANMLIFVPILLPSPQMLCLSLIISLSLEGLYYKTFNGRNLRILIIRESLSMTSLDSLILCLWVRPGAYPTLPVNIRLGWKALPGTNTLAYYENP